LGAVLTVTYLRSTASISTKIKGAKDFLKEQALKWAQQMLRAVGITDFDWSECLRYNSKAAKKLIESLKN
jgi:precorrin isomerase